MILLFLMVGCIMQIMSPLETSFYVLESDAIIAVLNPQEEAVRLSGLLVDFEPMAQQEIQVTEGWVKLYGVSHEGDTDHDVHILISFPGMFRRGVARLRGLEPTAIVHLRIG